MMTIFKNVLSNKYEYRNRCGRPKNKKIWIDLENSPHVLFFYPIVKALKMRGYQVVVTARDYAQVIELADLFKYEYIKIGKHFGQKKVMKVIGLFVRSFQLIPFIRSEKPALSFSHGSRTQLLASKIFNIPCIIAWDYEYGQHIPFIEPDIYLVPEVLLEKKDFKKRHLNLSSYPGIKEDIYIPHYIPNKEMPKFIGTKSGYIVATVRPPATEAHYHKPESSQMFEVVVNFLVKHASVKIIMLPRTQKQESLIKDKWQKYLDNKKIIIPEQALNGLDLIWNSDMVISGGGTMIREAAALNIPAYSFFQGKIGAVDQYLFDQGRLIILKSIEDVHNKIEIKKHKRIQKKITKNSSALDCIVENVEQMIASYA